MEYTGNINGCNIGSYSRLAKKCRKCTYKDYCKNKRLEQEAYIMPRPQINIDTSIMNNYGISINEAAKAINKVLQMANGQINDT